MIVSGSDIRSAIRKMWPDIGQGLIQTPDLSYFIPEIEDVLDQTKHLDLGAGMPSWWDCNHYALSAYAYIQNNNVNDGAAWAFGMAFGTKFNRFPMKHTLNICYSENGVWFIDLQNKKNWKADPKQDEIHTVTM